jgi:hypothetical protein
VKKKLIRVEIEGVEEMRDEVTGGWRKLHNEEIHNLYSSPSTIRMIRSRRMGWEGHVGSTSGAEEECIHDFGGKVRRKETTGKTKT